MPLPDSASMSIETTGPRACVRRGLGEESAEPPWRVPVSMTCSMRCSKMIS
jgi:hypothetical protein